jgi:hypothetical protein
MNKGKERAKGFVLGVLLTVLLSATVTVLASAGVMDVVFNVNHIVVNGNRLNLSEAERPFTSGGRTFLPARAIAEALGQSVSWDGNTGTVYINPQVTDIPQLPPAPPPAPSPRSLFDTVSAFESGGDAMSTLDLGTINMSGNVYANALRTQHRFTTNPSTRWENRNLNRQFTTITGTIGRVDGSGQNASTISFIGDGIQLASFSVDGNSMPIEISIDVSNVSILRIQFDISQRGAMIAFANAMIE